MNLIVKRISNSKMNYSHRETARMEHVKKTVKGHWFERVVAFWIEMNDKDDASSKCVALPLAHMMIQHFIETLSKDIGIIQNDIVIIIIAKTQKKIVYLWNWYNELPIMIIMLAVNIFVSHYWHLSRKTEFNNNDKQPLFIWNYSNSLFIWRSTVERSIATQIPEKKNHNFAKNNNNFESKLNVSWGAEKHIGYYIRIYSSACLFMYRVHLHL